MRPREPDWDAELDVDAYLAAIPRHIKTKGLFLSGLADRMVCAGVLEGGIRTFGGDVHIRVVEPGPGALDLYIEWLT